MTQNTAIRQEEFTLVDVIEFLDQKAEEEIAEAKDIADNPEAHWPEEAAKDWEDLDDETRQAFKKQEVKKCEQAEQEWKDHADRVMVDLEEMDYGDGDEEVLDDFDEDEIRLVVREQTFRNYISSEAALDAGTGRASPSEVDAGKAIMALQNMVKEMPPAMAEATGDDPANLSDKVGRAIFLYFRETGGPKNLSRS